jgi:hypothetical protein
VAGVTWTADQVALLGDSRLHAEARVVGLVMSLQDAGEDGSAPVGFPELRELLPALTDDRIRAALRQLEACGWTERRAGGRGHPDRFTFLGSVVGAVYSQIRLALARNLMDRFGCESSLNALRLGCGPSLSPPSTTTPPPSPPPAQGGDVEKSGLHPDAARAVEGAVETLQGCRGSLRDYLADRVDPELQYAYVQRLVTSLEGADEWMWKDRRGGTLHDGRTGILAAALNELLACPETGRHFPEAPGGFGNLRSKVRYLVAAQLGTERDATHAPPRMSAAEEEADIQGKREAARQRCAEANSRTGSPQKAEAWQWYKTQNKRVQEEVDLEAETRLRLLYHDLRDAPEGYVEACFQEAVRKVREAA